MTLMACIQHVPVHTFGKGYSCAVCHRALPAQIVWQSGQPRRCETNQVGAAGECLACDAEQGVACLKPKREA